MANGYVILFNTADCRPTTDFIITLLIPYYYLYNNICGDWINEKTLIFVDRLKWRQEWAEVPTVGNRFLPTELA